MDDQNTFHRPCGVCVWGGGGEGWLTVISGIISHKRSQVVTGELCACVDSITIVL